MLPNAKVAASRSRQSSGLPFLPMFSVTNGMTHGMMASCNIKRYNRGYVSSCAANGETEVQEPCSIRAGVKRYMHGEPMRGITSKQEAMTQQPFSPTPWPHAHPTCAVRASRPKQVPAAMAMFHAVSSCSWPSSCFVSCFNSTGTKCGVTALMKLWLGCASTHNQQQGQQQGTRPAMLLRSGFPMLVRHAMHHTRHAHTPGKSTYKAVCDSARCCGYKHYTQLTGRAQLSCGYTHYSQLTTNWSLSTTEHQAPASPLLGHRPPPAQSQCHTGCSRIPQPAFNIQQQQQ
jgi:hypothetical protein